MSVRFIPPRSHQDVSGILPVRRETATRSIRPQVQADIGVTLHPSPLPHHITMPVRFGRGRLRNGFVDVGFGMKLARTQIAVHRLDGRS